MIFDSYNFGNYFKGGRKEATFVLLVIWLF